MNHLSEHQIIMHQNSYVKRIEQLKSESMTKNRLLTTAETCLFKIPNGQLQWASKPDQILPLLDVIEYPSERGYHCETLALNAS